MSNTTQDPGDNLYSESSAVVWIVFAAFCAFIVWSLTFELDQFVRGQGKVISSSRIQVIQSVDGGVLSELMVREGNQVKAGQVLARLDQARFEASTNEILARVNALKAKIARLRAEVQGSPLVFPPEIRQFQELVQVETALYERRLKSLNDDTQANMGAIAIAERERRLVEDLKKTGDVDQVEVFRSERNLIDTRAKMLARKNQYYEQASQELVKAEDELAQNTQILNQRQELLGSSILKAPVDGIVNNVSITTIGAVLRAGEELMQILPTGDTLIIETKISPQDISDVRVGLPATLRFDTFDSSIFGSVAGTVSHVSPDTIVERTGAKEETFYIAHIKFNGFPVKSSIEKSLEVIPGMTTQVDIKTSQRTVFNYLMKPITKTFTEAFGER